jgi:hypothetical protein
MKTRVEIEEWATALRHQVQQLEWQKLSLGDRRDADGLDDLEELLAARRSRLEVLEWMLAPSLRLAPDNSLTMHEMEQRIKRSIDEMVAKLIAEIKARA